MSALVLFNKNFSCDHQATVVLLMCLFSTVNYLRKAILGKVIKLLYSVSHSHVMLLLGLE